MRGFFKTVFGDSHSCKTEDFPDWRDYKKTKDFFFVTGREWLVKARSGIMAGKLTYQQAGVDTRKAAALVGDIGTHVRRTQQTRKLWGAFGLFAACYDLSSYKEPVMMTGCDGVGTKLELLLEHDLLETAGKDLVAMSVNDILTTGGDAAGRRLRSGGRLQETWSEFADVFSLERAIRGSGAQHREQAQGALECPHLLVRSTSVVMTTRLASMSSSTLTIFHGEEIPRI